MMNKQERPYIFCHMETSLDGKIMGKYLWIEETNAYLVKIYDSTGRLLPVVTAFATRQGAEAYVHDFLPTGKYQDGAAACKAEIVKTEVRK